VSILALWLKRGFIGELASPGGSVAAEVVNDAGLLVVNDAGLILVLG
jgi:hypothetical protein